MTFAYELAASGVANVKSAPLEKSPSIRAVPVFADGLGRTSEIAAQAEFDLMALEVCEVERTDLG